MDAITTIAIVILVVAVVGGLIAIISNGRSGRNYDRTPYFAGAIDSWMND